jgi:hypothetical protein
MAQLKKKARPEAGSLTGYSGFSGRPRGAGSASPIVTIARQQPTASGVSLRHESVAVVLDQIEPDGGVGRAREAPPQSSYTRPMAHWRRPSDREAAAPRPAPVHIASFGRRARLSLERQGPFAASPKLTCAERGTWIAPVRCFGKGTPECLP